MEQVRLFKYSDYPIPYINIDNHDVNYNLKKLLNKTFCKINRCVPIDMFKNILTISLENPCLEKKNIIEEKTGKKVLIFRSHKNEIDNFINRLYSKKEIKEEKQINWKG